MSVPKLSWKELYQCVYETWPWKPSFTEKDYPSLDGKVVVVTGGNAGVGYQTAKKLLISTNAKVYIFARSKEKTLAAIEKLKDEVKAASRKAHVDVHFIQVDLGDLTSIKPAVEEFLSKEKRLDIIIHNAGVMTPPAGSKTKQGYELQLGTNVIGPFLLQKLLDPIFIKTSTTNEPNTSRVVWVSSSAHMFSVYGGFNWDDLNYEKNPKKGMEIYGQSKAGDAILSILWPKKHPEARNVVSVTLCPGYLKTELQRHLPSIQSLLFGFLLSKAEYGAYTELFAALSPEVTTAKNGSFIIPYGEIGIMRRDIRETAKGENGERVWDYLEEQVKPYL